MNLIAVVDEQWAIGKNKNLLAHLPKELTYFKEKTLGKTVVMGRETLETLPGGRPLSGRKNIVLSRDPLFEADCTVCNSLETLFEILKNDNKENVFIIGGEQIYRLLSPYCERFFITKIFKTYQGDKFLENLDEKADLKIVWESPMQEEKGTEYKFLEFNRE